MEILWRGGRHSARVVLSAADLADNITHEVPVRSAAGEQLWELHIFVSVLSCLTWVFPCPPLNTTPAILVAADQPRNSGGYIGGWVQRRKLEVIAREVLLFDHILKAEKHYTLQILQAMFIAFNLLNVHIPIYINGSSTALIQLIRKSCITVAENRTCI